MFVRSGTFECQSIQQIVPRTCASAEERSSQSKGNCRGERSLPKEMPGEGHDQTSVQETFSAESAPFATIMHQVKIMLFLLI